LPADSDVLAYVRRTAKESILCVFNFSTTDMTYTLPIDHTFSILKGSDLHAKHVGHAVQLSGGGAVYLEMK
jgi:glycosidase